MGPEGKRIALIARRHHGHHLEVAELIDEAMVAAILAVDRGVEIREPGGYLYRVMRNVLVDVGGGEAVDIDDETAIDDRDDVGIEVDQSTVDELFDEIRVGLESSGAPATHVSAALAKLAVGDAPSIDLDDLPTPIAGAAPAEAQWWPCAYLATLDHGMFPVDGRAGQSARKRRSRFIASARTLLERLMAGVLPTATSADQ